MINPYSPMATICEKKKVPGMITPARLGRPIEIGTLPSIELGGFRRSRACGPMSLRLRSSASRMSLPESELQAIPLERHREPQHDHQ